MIAIQLSYNGGEFANLPAALTKLERSLLNDQTTQKCAEFVLEKVQQYPPYQYVSRKQAYGQTFKSDKQRRWFFAALNSGALTIPYNRTNQLKSGWSIVASGHTRTVTNSVKYAGYVMGDNSQSRMQALIGWRTTQAFVRDYDAAIGRVALASVEEQIKDAGLA